MSLPSKKFIFVLPTTSKFQTTPADRLTHKSGGTAILIKNSLPHHPTPISSTSFENTSISIDLPNGFHITLASIYRPPHGKINTSELHRILNQISKSIVVGEFNAKHPSWSTGRSNSNGAVIHNFIASNNLIIIAPQEPTHFPINAPSSSTLDFGIMCNIASGTSLNELSSDHNPVLFEIDININLSALPKTIKTKNWSVFSTIIQNSIPGNPLIETTQDIDDAITKFTASIVTALNQASKAKIIKGPPRKLPPEIVDKIKLKNRWHKFWQMTFYPPYKLLFTKLQNEIREDINEYDNNSWKELLESLNPEDNSLFDFNRKLTKKFFALPPILYSDGLKYTPLGKANAFLHSLENSFQVNPEPYCNDQIRGVKIAVNDYFKAPPPPSNPKLTSPKEIIDIIKKLNVKKATGPDGIPNKAIKMLTINAITHLTKIFNRCLQLNHFPTVWKIAHVLMFPKPNQNPKLPGSYRPISLLSNIGKIFEKLLLARLTEFCNDNSIIPDDQFGFRKNHSCVHQLLRVTNTICEGFNAKLITGGVFLDVRKSFD
ncbi:putative RNA-directed DNA polymerase like protein [Argiope bruennichi]|uniref:Putative RNA-directed DNA polymerase like protein n=1 Tax=Argiope bruennichi TaxID=94029 RepID=A0A8T0FF80_ARGBR|nr:putative RNA-directed DNA polymerase like protein [Argiope bruennichi]